eukprot:scaffold4384_cov180-Ochromonas_danica.AAC.7
MNQTSLVVVIEDLSTDPHFQESILCTEGNYHFYVGCAIIVNGLKIGSITLLDRMARSDWTEEQSLKLEEIASMISMTLECRRHRVLAEERNDSLRIGLTLIDHLKPSIQSLLSYVKSEDHSKSEWVERFRHINLSHQIGLMKRLTVELQEQQDKQQGITALSTITIDSEWQNGSTMFIGWQQLCGGQVWEHCKQFSSLEVRVNSSLFLFLIDLILSLIVDKSHASISYVLDTHSSTHHKTLSSDGNSLTEIEDEGFIIVRITTSIVSPKSELIDRLIFKLASHAAGDYSKHPHPEIDGVFVFILSLPCHYRIIPPTGQDMLPLQPSNQVTTHSRAPSVMSESSVGVSGVFVVSAEVAAKAWHPYYSSREGESTRFDEAADYSVGCNSTFVNASTRREDDSMTGLSSSLRRVSLRAQHPHEEELREEAEESISHLIPVTKRLSNIRKSIIDLVAHVFHALPFSSSISPEGSVAHSRQSILSVAGSSLPDAHLSRTRSGRDSSRRKVLPLPTLGSLS